MKLRERDEPLDPEVERELDAVDRALAGRPVDPDLAGWEELTALLADERPEPGRRMGGGDRPARRRRAPQRGRRRPAAEARRALRNATDDGCWRRRERWRRWSWSASSAVSTLEQGSDEATSVGDSGRARERRLERRRRDATVEPRSRRRGGASRLPSSGRRRRRLEPIGRGTCGDPRLQAPRRPTRSPPAPRSGRSSATSRSSLSTRPDEVRETSDEAIAITRALGGIVASSQVSEAGRQSSATLQLTIPTRNLDSAIDQLTELANVESLNEATVDITKPFVSAQDRLEDAEAERARAARGARQRRDRRRGRGDAAADRRRPPRDLAWPSRSSRTSPAAPGSPTSA